MLAARQARTAARVIKVVVAVLMVGALVAAYQGAFENSGPYSGRDGYGLRIKIGMFLGQLGSYGAWLLLAGLAAYALDLAAVSIEHRLTAPTRPGPFDGAEQSIPVLEVIHESDADDDSRWKP